MEFRNKMGFIPTGGNLFYVDNAEVKLSVAPWTDGYSVHLLVPYDSDFVLMHKFLTDNNIKFKVHRNASWNEAKGYFPISFQLASQKSEEDAIKKFNEISELISDERRTPKYVDVS